jgi:hypothetical protein
MWITMIELVKTRWKLWKKFKVKHYRLQKVLKDLDAIKTFESIQHMLPKSSDDHLSIIPWLTLMLVHNHTFQNKYGQVIIIFQMSSCQVLRNIIVKIINNQNINFVNRYD